MSIVKLMLAQQDAYCQGKEAAMTQLSPHCPLTSPTLRHMWLAGWKDCKFELLSSKEYVC